MGYVQQGHGGIGTKGCYTNGLRRGLVAYWRLEEASGTRVDATGRGNNLTDNNTVTQATGKVGNAGQFTRANSEYLSIADNPDLSVTGSKTWAQWLYADSLTTENGWGAQWGGVGNRTWFATFDGTNRLWFRLNTPDNDFDLLANSFGAPSTGVWMFVVHWWDTVASKIYIQVNNGTVDSLAVTNTPVDSTANYVVGADVSGGGQAWDGRIDEVGIWNRTLTAQERTRTNNGGTGRSWPNL